MTPEQKDVQKTENEWWRMRQIGNGELLKLKSETGNDFTRELVDNELERRAFAESVRSIDGWRDRHSCSRLSHSSPLLPSRLDLWQRLIVLAR